VKDGTLLFSGEAVHMPALGAEAFPLNEREDGAVLGPPFEGRALSLGLEARSGVGITTPIDGVLSRHMAVIGASGHGKSCYVAWIVQQLLSGVSHPRIVVFDVNGEYAAAFNGAGIAVRTLGGSGGLRIPYYALGRQGLGRLLLPSEKTQRPALAFALENLPRIQADTRGAWLVGQEDPILFDDCRAGSAAAAFAAVEQLRAGTAPEATRWPHMRGLAALVADGYALKNDRGTIVRDAFNFGHVAPLINRINRLIDDPQFSTVVDIEGGPSRSSGSLSWKAEGDALVTEVFGGPTRDETRLRIIDLSRLSHDLMPFVLGSLLELFASTLFDRGPAGTYPTPLVLEEAHHYLRQLPSEPDTGMHSLAYERLAKEGRKFGLALLLSTQRPSEISPTVLSQCGTRAVFRLTNESDLKAIGAASEWSSKRLVDQIPALPRRQAVLFGAGVRLPTRVTIPKISPTPKSGDPPFDEAWA
jgi:hypothetical protein